MSDKNKARCLSPRRDKADKPGTHRERSHGGSRHTERDDSRRQRRLGGNDMLDNGDDHHMPRSWP